MTTARAMRATRQRAAVSGLLDRLADFRSAQEIHEELRRVGEGIGLTTVYRTLQALADAGEVDVLRTGSGESVYRRCATDDHHHHLVCRQCGKAVEIAGPAVETWAQRVADEHGYTDLSHTVEIFGLCRECGRFQGPSQNESSGARPRANVRGRGGEHWRGPRCACAASTAARRRSWPRWPPCSTTCSTPCAAASTSSARSPGPLSTTAGATPPWSRPCGRVRSSRTRGASRAGRRSSPTADLAELKLDGDVAGFHRALLRLRDHYASRHANPRETFTVGVAQRTNGTAAGVAVVGAPQPAVDDTTVRQLGRIAYGLSGLVDARMQAAQQKVHLVAQELDAARLAALPLVGRAGAGLSYSANRTRTSRYSSS